MLNSENWTREDAARAMSVGYADGIDHTRIRRDDYGRLMIAADAAEYFKEIAAIREEALRNARRWLWVIASCALAEAALLLGFFLRG